MPTVSKQSRKAKPQKSSNPIASKIVPVSTIKKGMKMLVYGEGKTGKTRLFGTFPTPSLLIGTEEGTASISDTPGIDFFQLTSSDEFNQLLDVIKEGNYRTVGVDTAGGFQDIILMEVLGLDDIPVSKFKQASKGQAWGIADQGTWGTVGTQFKEHMRNFLRLADDHEELDLFIIAHERSFGDERKSELMTPTVGAALTPAAAKFLNGACDYVCQMFKREQTEETSIKVSGKEIKQTKKTGKAEYCLRIGEHPVYLTGFRVTRNIELPDVIVDPDYDKIRAVIEGEA